MTVASPGPADALGPASGPRRRAADEGRVSATEPDWSREAKRWFRWDPSRSLLAAVRSHRSAPERVAGLRPVVRAVAVLRHRFWSAVTGADIPLNACIEGGLLLPHPNGVVVHPEARIGPNCIVFQQVTLGMGGKLPGAPVLSGHVDVGAGAKILGGVRIGMHATIGANAVVLQDVPDGATAVGIPARILTVDEEPRA